MLETTIVGSNLNTAGDIKTALTNVPSNIGGVRNFSEVDNGAKTGVVRLLSPETSLDYRLRVGTDTVLLSHTFNYTAQDIRNWHYMAATLSCSQPAGYLNFGTVQGTLASHGAFMRSKQYFPLLGTSPLSVEITAGIFVTPFVANEVFVAGLGSPTTANTLPTDAVYFKMTTAGLVGVSVSNGVDTETSPFNFTMALNTYYKFVIIVDESVTEFWVNNQLLGSIVSSGGQPITRSSAPVFMQRICTGKVSNTASVRVTDITVLRADISENRGISTAAALSGLSSNASPAGTSITTPTAVWVNNTHPTPVALTNTAAAFTGLGGRVAFLPTLASGTDGILFSYQNPLGTATATGRNLVITGINFNTVVSSALTGGACVFEYALAYGNVSGSLAATNTTSFHTNTTTLPAVVPLGISTVPAGAAVGTGIYEKSTTFPTPIVVRPSEFVSFVVTNIGTVTTAGAITVLCHVNGYWN